jgi:hypothetical protein
MAMTDEEKTTVNKRLLIGLGLTAAFCAAALVPDKQTRAKPSKPCFFYLVPLLRIKALLPELEATVASADTAKLRSGVAVVLCVSSPLLCTPVVPPSRLCSLAQPEL